jgi:hypothetical protein
MDLGLFWTLGLKTINLEILCKLHNFLYIESFLEDYFRH